MSFYNSITFADSLAMDAFARHRVSEPLTIFDSKQIFDNQPLFWDEALESGAGITSSHNANQASTTITSTLNTAGTFTRQTFMRFNYQPGKSQLVFLTGVIAKSGGGTGVERRIGMFDDENGIFFYDEEGTYGVCRRTYTSGSTVDNAVDQADWNVDKFDGTGPSGYTLDFSKTQIFFFDFEWLGVGRVRMGFVIDGMPLPCHEFNNANTLTTVYMSTPNLPLRYQMITTASSPASTMDAICASVVSEGGERNNGVIQRASTSGTHLDGNTENTVYALIGLRLKTGYIGLTVDLINVTLQEQQGNKTYEWILLWNPTVAGTFTYSDKTNSGLQVAIGAAANTVTGGLELAGGFLSSTQRGGSGKDELDNALRLGSAIDGTRDEIVLCIRPVGGSTNGDYEGSITWRELQ